MLNVASGKRLRGFNHHATGRQKLPSEQRCNAGAQAEGAVLALRLERTFNKRQLLELYLNEIYLGLGSYGVAAAA